MRLKIRALQGNDKRVTCPRKRLGGGVIGDAVAGDEDMGALERHRPRQRDAEA
jgi:hypothetical protein